MRVRAAIICGVVLIVIGVAALIRPQFSYRVEQHRENVAGSNVLFETRRIVRFPLWFSIPILAIGAGMVILGLQKN
jgi:putative Mn2+ efflux pump MntP